VEILYYSLSPGLKDFLSNSMMGLIIFFGFK